MSRAERMSPVDTTWLRMDRPNNPMVIVGVFKLAGPVDTDRLERTLADRLLAYRRFRQRVEPRRSGMWWVEDRYFDLSRHMHRVRLPGKGGDAELEHFVGELAATPLDHTIPLWQYHIVEGVEGGAAVVVRIHHSIGDGIALIGVMLSLTDELHDGEEDRHWTESADEEHGDWWKGLFTPITQAVEVGAKLSGRVLKKSHALTSRPGKALGLVRDGANVVSELAGLLFMSNDTPTSLKGMPRGVKKVAWAEPLPLGEIKAVSRALDCSVNDVLMSCVAGAINRYLAGRGERTDRVEVRALIPVNLRGPARQGELGNEFGIVTLVLPVGIADPMARLAEVRRRMDELKSSYQAAVTYGLLAVLGYTPKLAQDMLFNLLLSRATAVMTNVPGPQAPMSIAGSEITQLMFWVPQSGDIGVGVSILSYAGKVQFGLITDAALVPEPSEIIAQFGPQFEELLYTTLLDHADRGEASMSAPAAAKRRHRQRATAAAPSRPAKTEAGAAGGRGGGRKAKS